MTIKEIKSIYKVFNESDNKYVIYDGYDYRGYFTKDKTKFFFHGFPEDEPIRFTSINELNEVIHNFLNRCENEWINPNGFNPINNSGHNAELAFFYLAEKFGWKRAAKFSSNFTIGSNAFGVRAFEIEPDYDYNKGICKFTIRYNAGWFSTSPEFSDYRSAMSWLKSTIGPIMLSIGTDFIETPMNSGMIGNEMEDVVMNKINFSGGGINIDEASLKDHLIATLEKQLEMLKSK